MAGPVGRPVDGHGARQPDCAVARVQVPVAIAVQLLVADDFARDVTRRDRLILALVAGAGPGVKVVLNARTGGGRCQIGACEAALLPIAKVERGTTVAINRAATRLGHHAGSVGSRVGVYTIVAGLVDDKCQVGRVDFQPLAFKERAYPHSKRALFQPQLRHVVTQCPKVEAGLLVHAHRG